MVKMLRYIVIVAYFALALGQFRSNYNCNYIKQAIKDPVTLGQISGTWYEVERVSNQNRCISITIGKERSVGSRLNLKQKYEWKYSNGRVLNGSIAQDTTAVGRFNTSRSDENGQFWMVRTGGDVNFNNYALMLSCKNHYYNHLNSDVYMSLLSRSKTLSGVEKKNIYNNIKKELGFINGLTSDKFRSMCPSTVHSTKSTTPKNKPTKTTTEKGSYEIVISTDIGTFQLGTGTISIVCLILLAIAIAAYYVYKLSIAPAATSTDTPKLPDTADTKLDDGGGRGGASTTESA